MNLKTCQVDYNVFESKKGEDFIILFENMNYFLKNNIQKCWLLFKTFVAYNPEEMLTFN